MRQGWHSKVSGETLPWLHDGLDLTCGCSVHSGPVVQWAARGLEGVKEMVMVIVAEKDCPLAFCVGDVPIVR